MSPEIEALIAEWKEKIYHHGYEIDPHDNFCWTSLAIGFALGKGFTVYDSVIFERELMKRELL